ncbi:hypothetical protein C2S52_015081 [Perilla frutescens var. hirtella]|nr:hypothetical protein C2S52_015081 [Perilla frutescens var. hirtella]
MEGIREIAKSYYDRVSEGEMNSLLEFFRKLDSNGDGKISLSEFKKSVSSWLSAEAVFQKLDENGDGSLDFQEFLCLHYMDKVKMSSCSGCWDLLVGPYFSCLLCLIKGHRNRSRRFDLCCACYRRLHDFPHHHSANYVLDHHSLLITLTEKAAAADATQNQREMEELRKIAKAYYRSGSPEVQESGYEFFKSMDTDGDGRVDRAEFLEFMRKEGYSHMRKDSFFDDLDNDGNGNLDFSEVMTLYYIIRSGRPFCGRCKKFLPGVFFSCVDCFKNPDMTSFDLCLDCFTHKKCDHNHNGRSQFLDNYTLLQVRTDPALALTSGVNSNQASNAIVPVQQSNNMYNTYTTNNTHIVHPSNAIVPAASNWDKWRVALHAFEIVLGIGSISAGCTIL